MNSVTGILRPWPAEPAEPVARPGSPDLVTRALGLCSAACIGAAIIIMIAVSAAGPSSAVVSVPAPAAGPPWWFPAHLTMSFLTVTLWAAAVLGGGGVAAGLLAVRRGALSHGSAPGRLLVAAALLVTAVLAVLPAAGSTDTLDYAAYGRMVVLGHSPYVMTPLQLRESGDPVGAAAPRAWQSAYSDYGPLATVEQAAAAELGGASAARIIFWLKLWNALAFGLIVILLDRLLRGDPVRRVRAHLLWSVNPLLLWGLVAGGHIDAIAAALGIAGLALIRPGPLRPGQRGADPGLLRLLVAGLMIGDAADFKITFALFGLGAAWSARGSVRALLAVAAGALAVVVPSYVWFGPPALTVLTTHRDATTDTMYRLLAASFTHVSIAQLSLVVLPVVAVMAGLLLWRLPDGFPALPAIQPALALSLAWTLAWPYQRPWYAAMAVCLLALYPASRLDWPVLFQLTAGTTTYLPGLPGRWPGLLGSFQNTEVVLLIPAARLAALAAVVVLCLTRAWYPRRPRVLLA